MRYYAILLVLLTGCSSFLDEIPDNRVELNDLDKAAQLIANAYSTASPAFTDWMTDDAAWLLGPRVRPSQEQVFRWEDASISDPTEQDTPDFYWFQTYQAIAHANEVLAVIDNIGVAGEEDEAKKKAVRSEALLTRAYGHFMLAIMFAPDFRANPGADAIPYIKKPETVFVGKYERKSVRRVYDNIENDLLEGLKLVDDSFFTNSGKYHFNKNAALAFACRFYLFKGDYDRCVQYADQLLGNSPEAFVRDLGDDDFQDASSSITLYPRIYSSPDLQANIMLMRKTSLVQRTDFGFGPQTNVYRDLFRTTLFRETTDQRENPALVKGQDGVFPSRYESLFERSSLNSNVGTPYHIAIAFRGEEVLFNRAEANIYLGQPDKVIADLLVLSRRRYTGAPLELNIERVRAFLGATNNPDFSDEDALLNYLLFEKRKEFITQGMRWFDIKRYNISVTHFAFGEQQPLVLQGNDLRKVLQIPKSAQDISGLTANPR